MYRVADPYYWHEGRLVFWYSTDVADLPHPENIYLAPATRTTEVVNSVPYR
jgi:hypothetical protein